MTHTLTSLRLPAILALLLGAAISGSAIAATIYTALDIGAPGCAYAKMNGKGQFTGNCFNQPVVGQSFITDPNGRNVHTLEGLAALRGVTPTGLNPQGTVVGFGFTEGWLGQQRAWFQVSGQPMVVLGYLGNGASRAADINVKGLLVGSSPDASGRSRGFWVEPGTTELHPMASSGGSDELLRVNGNGTVVGSVSSSLAFYAKPPYTQLVYLDTLGGSHSTAVSLNDLGDIVGHATNTAGVYRAFAGKVGRSSIIELRTLAGHDAKAWDINKAGLIVGHSVRESDLQQVAFSCTGDCSDWVDLNSVTTGLPEGVLLTKAQDVSNRGQIGAYGSDGRIYLLTPTAN